MLGAEIGEAIVDLSSRRSATKRTWYSGEESGTNNLRNNAFPQETQETKKHTINGKPTSKPNLTPIHRDSGQGISQETSGETALSALTERERAAFEVLEACHGNITDAELAKRVGYANRSGTWKARQKWKKPRT